MITVNLSYANDKEVCCTSIGNIITVIQIDVILLNIALSLVTGY